METTVTTHAGDTQSNIQSKTEASCNKKNVSICTVVSAVIVSTAALITLMTIYKLKWSTMATIIYFYSYLILLITLAFYVHITEEHNSKKSFIKSLWNKRGIFGQVIVHVYDTATDLGVLIQWYILMQEEKTGKRDIESLNMEGLFWTTIAFLIMYRVVSCCCSFLSAGFDSGDEGIGCGIISIFDGCCLGLLDLYIIKVVYIAIKDEEEEAPPRQKLLQLIESIFESLPQVVLQSVFIIRGYNDEELRKDNSLILVGVSLFASLFSIANKYTWVDKDGMNDKAKEPEFKKDVQCINGYYVLRIIWRFSYVFTRFCVISLVWSVIGGAFVGVFLGFSWVLWFVTLFIYALRNDLFDPDEATCCLVGMVCIPYGIVSLVASPAIGSRFIAMIHMLEMIISLTIITIFGYNESLNCSICANPNHRQAEGNPFILMFIIAAWVSMVIDFITYVLMLCLDVFGDDEEGFMSIARMFVSGVENDPEANDKE